MTRDEFIKIVRREFLESEMILDLFSGTSDDCALMLGGYDSVISKLRADGIQSVIHDLSEAEEEAAKIGW